MGNMCSSNSVEPGPQKPPVAPSPVPPTTEEEPKQVEETRPATRALSARPISRAVSLRADSQTSSLIRLLLLGAAESGKSTLLAQIRILYEQNYAEVELLHRKVAIYSNILSSIQKLIEFVQSEGKTFSAPENGAHAQNLLLEEPHYTRFTAEQEKAIQAIWKEPVIQEAYKRRSAVNLNDSTKYFLDNLDRINSTEYHPTPTDLIMSYIPTIGVQNVIFTTNNKTFQLFDMGGQKMDRRKWTDMYDGIDAIFFSLAISEYDQVLNEDMKTNRLEDSMDLLDKIAHEPQFEETPIFVFLNEMDVFTNKLGVFPLEDFLPDYKGKSTEDALNFIEGMARSRLGRTEKKHFHIYRTVMVDTKAMEKILKEIFKKHLR